MEKNARANVIVRNHVIFAAGGGMIPIPLIDIAAVTAIQLDMLQQLSHLYGIEYTRASGRSLVTALTSSVLARLGASAIKAIPGIGTILGGVSNAILSGAATYAVGEVFSNHFEAGGTLEDFDAMSYREAYKEHFEEGKKKTRQWHTDKDDVQDEASAADRQKAKLERLKELGQLKEEGIISEEEFDEMKKKILDEF